MSRYVKIEFHSAFADDSVEDDAGFVQWPGRNVVEVLKAGLEARGYEVSDPIDAQESGWELDISRNKKRFWLKVSLIESDENYLNAGHMTWSLWPDQKVFDAFLADLKAILGADGRFSRVSGFPTPA
ncbi:hypothetical protein [Phenylobacterium aquaticum]|uniref:hypothetical protein n=1 Tax=Phenylobacterium aquaticum TaxID=1763816 RepID=UPI0026F24ADB|nr:hypothetical protein [Phenylobacterium aquaticum]